MSGLLTALQQADSAFPSGGFAFSNGLEGLEMIGKEYPGRFPEFPDSWSRLLQGLPRHLAEEPRLRSLRRGHPELGKDHGDALDDVSKAGGHRLAGALGVVPEAAVVSAQSGRSAQLVQQGELSGPVAKNLTDAERHLLILGMKS